MRGRTCSPRASLRPTVGSFLARRRGHAPREYAAALALLPGTCRPLLRRRRASVACVAFIGGEWVIVSASHGKIARETASCVDRAPSYRA